MTFEQWKKSNDPRFKFHELSQAEYDREERIGIMDFKENYQQIRAVNLSKGLFAGRLDQNKTAAELTRMDRDWR